MSRDFTNTGASAEEVIRKQELSLKFEEQVGTMHDKVAHNKAEFLILTIVRDSLLPKLLSGEIIVKEAEKLMEAVAQ